MTITVDIEVTNRCNAKCHFCPRDRTPHQGLMGPEVFAQSLERAVQLREAMSGFNDPDVEVSLCGLGEPLLNRSVADYVRQTRAAGLRVKMSSNASLLDERRSEELLSAGLQEICINVGEEGDEYEEIYGLPFDRTLENVIRFNEMAKGKCLVLMVVVDHRNEESHVEKMRRFWTERGVGRILSYQVMNRGGSLFVDHMQYEQYPELGIARDQLDAAVTTPLCGAPFAFPFIGYDGQYYMCCSDWEKKAPMGSVFDESFDDVIDAKLAHLASREPVCRTCNLDPVNRLTEELRSEANGESPAGSAQGLLTTITTEQQGLKGFLDYVGREVPRAPKTRRRIPVQAD